MNRKNIVIIVRGLNVKPVVILLVVEVEICINRPNGTKNSFLLYFAIVYGYVML